MGSIELDEITFFYGTVEEDPLFADFSLTVSPGEWLAVVGPSGAGKTTLLKLIKGLLRPQRGKIKANSTLLPAGALNPFAACVFANPENQIVSPVVAEDVAFALENMGLAPEIISARVEEALKWVGLWQQARDFSHHLSGGEQQRLILAGALAQRKSCLLLDDPLSMVGGRSRGGILSLLQTIHRKLSCTMMHTTHLLEEAVVAQRLIALERGKVVFDGSPYHFLQEEELIEELGLEVPAIVRLDEMLSRSGLAEPGGLASLEQLLEILTVSEQTKDNETE
jgi:energy-coupling factor transport system ATP-binding protein